MRPAVTKCLTLSVLVLPLIAAATPAAAYIGPGAGLSMLGALWALVAAVGAAIGFLILWPIRRAMRRKRAAAAATTTTYAADEREPSQPNPVR